MSATVEMESTRPRRAGGSFTRLLATTTALVLAFVGIGLTQAFSASAVAPTYQVDATISMGAVGDNLAVDSTRGLVYVAQRNAGAVAVYDTGTLQLLRTIPVPNQPISIAIDEPSGYVYVAQYTGDNLQGALAVIAPGGTAVAGTVNLGNSPVGIIRSRFGPTLYVANMFGNSIMYVDISTPSAPVVARTIPVTLTPSNVSENATGSQLYVSSVTNSRYFVLNVVAGTQGAQWTGITQVYEAMPNPAGTSVFATSGSSALRIMNPTTNLQTGTGISNVRSLSRDLAAESMFAAVGTGSVAVLDPATGALLQSLPAPAASMIDTDTVRHRTFVTSPNGTTLTVIGRVPVLPTVTTNPTSVTVDELQPASFTAAFSSEFTTTTQWQSSPDGATWTNVPAATSNTLNIPSTPYSSNGLQYRAVFTNGAGSVATTAATLTVIPLAPIVTVDPANVSILEGSTATFSAAATSSVPQTQAWQQSGDGVIWTTIPGETGGTLTLSNRSLADSGTMYRSVFTNATGATTTAAATLTVTPLPPVVTTDPADVSAPEFGSASFTAASTSSVPQTQSWEVSTDTGTTWTTIPGETSATLTLDSLDLAQDGNLYRAVFTNSAGSTPTNFATLTVTPIPPVIVDNPADVTIVEGENASFTASATSSIAVTQTWEQSTDSGATWTVIPNENGATLTLNAVPLTADGRLIRSVFTSTAGSTPTAAAMLTVNPAPPVLATSPVDLSVIEGNDATFVASATSSVAQTVRWERSTDGITWTLISGATGESLTITDAQLSENGLQLRAVFTNIAGSVTTDAATLTVTPAPPVVIVGPVDTLAQEHGNAAFTAAATSSVGMTVQWQTSTDGITWADVPGATSTTFTLTDVLATQNGLRVRAVFTNSAGSVVTGAATLSVIVTPVPIPFFPPAGLATTGLQANLFVAAWTSVGLIVLGGVYLFIAAVRRRRREEESAA